ncbi:tyrosine/phenylalanine carboxypeptidase domain-containing protein [Sandaracinus amylolyticus]|uniref:tyrosine/phenylalanine carboxypeptidase domain-containing protein n=1 Tax=Sandaracinus amylolyticus TaxID=927083 RepID=UPI0009FAE931|nr:tyrosine/phenylalanine carboxypeptidase domain-containing protein [Sandaracinus amylolyticus]
MRSPSRRVIATTEPAAAKPESAPSIAEILAGIAPLDALLLRISREARVLPALTPANAASERARLVEQVGKGEAPVPRWELARRRIEPAFWRAIDEARALARDRLPPALRATYFARLDELEVDLAMIECVGDPVRVRPLAARRFGTGMREVVLEDAQPVRVSTVARGLLERIAPSEEARVVEPETLAQMLRDAARAAGLDLEVRIDARLVAGAATGDRAVFIAARRFGRTESRRLVAHEILGHAVAASNATKQPLRIFEVGTAGSFADQEGLAICLEEQAGALDPHRMRVLAARVIATDRLHSGASFGETARFLFKQHGFSAESAVLITERAHRGGGVARDAGYLYGYLRVRVALKNGDACLDRLRVGRIGIDDLPAFDDACREGLAHPPTFTPTLADVMPAAIDEAAE